MPIYVNVLLLIAGFACLVKGADWFVDGSAGVARIFRVPSVIIGLTIVSMGTSAPELAVSVSAALKGSNEIALSNVVGSNIFNLIVVLGICAIIRPLPVDRAIVKRDFPISIGAALIVLGYLLVNAMLQGIPLQGDMAAAVGMIRRSVSVVLLVLFVAYLAYLVYQARKNKDEPAEEEKESPGGVKCALLIVIGLALVIAGGQLVVENARTIAAFFQMPETLIGLTVVSVGTSLPELVTSIVAARKGENDLAIGNVVGSNIFNILLILGVSCTIHPIEANLASFYDLIILAGVSLVAFLFALRKQIGRFGGAVFLAMYAADLTFAILRS